MNVQAHTRSPEFARFLDAVGDGADCGELLNLRVQIREKGPPQDLRRATEVLEHLGCFSSNGRGEASNAEVAEMSMPAKEYMAAYMACADDRRGIVRQSRASDVVDAALWYSNTVTGPIFRAVFVACLDALSGRQSRV